MASSNHDRKLRVTESQLSHESSTVMSKGNARSCCRVVDYFHQPRNSVHPCSSLVNISRHHGLSHVTPRSTQRSGSHIQSVTPPYVAYGSRMTIVTAKLSTETTIWTFHHDIKDHSSSSMSSRPQAARKVLPMDPRAIVLPTCLIALVKLERQTVQSPIIFSVSCCYTAVLNTNNFFVGAGISQQERIQQD
jgi:hypothetical protein